MILSDEHDAPACAARVLDTLESAGLARETAAQLAVAAGAASVLHAWPQPELEFRLARTLHQLGHADASRLLLRRALGERSLSRSAGSTASLLEAPPELFPLLRAGALRATGDGAWSLDAAALGRPDFPLELAYARLIGVFSDHLLPLWAPSQGRGELVLAGWRDHARHFSASRRDTARRCRAWRRDLADALRVRAQRRGWPLSPSVLLAEPV